MNSNTRPFFIGIGGPPADSSTHTNTGMMKAPGQPPINAINTLTVSASARRRVLCCALLQWERGFIRRRGLMQVRQQADDADQKRAQQVQRIAGSGVDDYIGLAADTTQAPGVLAVEFD